jgi:hypothetical protein
MRRTWFGWPIRLPALAALAGIAACWAQGGRPSMPPPEYEESPASATSGTTQASVPHADADAAVDVTRRQIDE